jgi:MFS family permease
MNVAGMLPSYVEKNYPAISLFEVGVLMSIFPIGFLLATPLIGIYMERFGRKNTVCLGAVLSVVSTFCFGIACEFGAASAFYWISFTARFVQGVADALVNVSTTAILTLEHPENQERWIGYCYTSLGLGLAVGPMLGSFVYDWIGYQNTFLYFFTAFILATGSSSISLLPSRLNTKAS